VTTTDISLALLLGPQLRAFAAAGYEVIGVSAPGPHVAQLEADGIAHYPLRHATRAMAPGRDALAFTELLQLFRDLRPDIVHTHNPKPGVYGRLAARCSDAELLQNVEDLAVLRRIGVPARRLRVLGNGIDLARFDRANVDPARIEVLRKEFGAETDEVICGVVGRLVWEKGYREVLEAARLLRDRVPNLRFAIIGPLDMDKRDAVTADDVDAAARLGNVRFFGYRDDVDECYAAMDLYVLASHREGFPRSAMEAAAMGVPVIATNIRGCRQVVERGTTGMLVEPRDPRALADAIEDLATRETVRAAMGEAAVAKARRDFDQQRVIDLTLETYDRVLAERRNRWW